MISSLRAMRTGPLVCVLVSAAWGHAQAVQGVGDTVYHLHGNVVNGTTGKPIARALVASADRRLATMTDSNGNFAIDVSVPVGGPESLAGANKDVQRMWMRANARLMLNAQRPGYISPTQQTALALDETLSSTAVTLKLMPAAAVTGRISAAETDAVANVRVMLIHHQSLGDGRLNWMLAGSFTTKTFGEFHFGNLQPGEYTVMTGEWRGNAPQQQDSKTVSQRYPPTFYGDGLSLERAVKLHLHYGDSAQAELHLHLANYYPVTIPVAKASGSTSINVQMEEVSPFSALPIRYNSSAGRVEGSLPNGHYTLLLSSGGPLQGARQPQRSFATATVDVAGAAVHCAPVALAPAGVIAVRVHAQLNQQPDLQETDEGIPSLEALGRGPRGSARQSPQLLQLTLESESSQGGYSTVPSQSGSNDELMVQNVPPGRYFVRAIAFRGYIASLSSGGVNLLQQSLVVGASGGASPIDVTIRDDNPKVSGTVTSGGPLPQQIYIALLPMDGSAQFTQSYSNSDGKFTVPNLAPGSYRVLAMPFRMRTLPYRDAEAMRAYDGKGTALMAVAGQPVHIDVPLLDAADVEDP